MEAKSLAEFDLGDAGFQVAPPLKADPGTLGTGSRNIIGFGLKMRRAWKGLKAATGGRTGSRVLFNASGVLGGLVDVSGNEAKGSVDVYLRNTIWFMGFGQLMYDGANITGAIASTTQKILVRYNNSYTHANSGPYDAGLPQPSRPIIAVRASLGTGARGKITGTTSAMIASIRSWTGDRSRASYASITVEGHNDTVRLTFPAAPVGGTGWAVFMPKLGFGGVGVHRRLRNANRVANREFLESDIERSVSDVVTNSTTTITSATAAFTSADIGKHVHLVKGASNFSSTIANVTGPTTAILALAVTFTDTAVTGTFTAYTDNVLRAVEIDYDDTDLTSEAAWIVDYPPQAAVYSFPLGDVRIVCGCLSDALTDPSVTNAGTCLSVSERNYPGSYDPLKLLYIPEKFVGGMGRPTDRHYYIFSENWTGAVQYTGADLGPAATVSTVWGETGFKKAHNACLAYGRIYGFSSKGEAVRLQNGEEPDTTFAADVQPVFDTWDPAKVVVSTYKHAVKYSHVGESYLFYLQTEKWLPACFLTDDAAGEIVSAQPIGQTTWLTMKSGSTFSLFEFDAGTGSTSTAMTNYVGGPVVHRPKTIQEVAETVVIDDTAKSYYISLHRNGQRLSIDDVTIASGDDHLYSASAKFTSEDVGKYVLVFKAAAGGVLPLLARIKTIVSAGAVTLVTAVRPLGVVAATAGASVTNGHAIIGNLIFSRTPLSRTGSQHKLGKRLNFQNCYSYAVGISILSNGDSAAAVKAAVLGSVKSGRAGNAAY